MKPTYMQIAKAIRLEIFSNRFSPGDGLPTENELARQYNTSRATIRKALNVLSNEDLVFSHQGKGSFVRRPEYNRYSMNFQLIKPEHTIKQIKLAIMEPDDEIKGILSLSDGNVVILKQMVLYTDEIPVACEDKYLLYQKGLPIIESMMSYSDFPLLMDKKYVSYDLHCELQIVPVGIDAVHAEILNCGAGEPVLQVRRIIKNENTGKVGYGLAYLRKEYGLLSAESGHSIYTGKL